jgi:superfamily II DNA/RNA helicase
MSAQSQSQSVYEVFEHQKVELLLHLLDSLPDFNTVIVFARTREGVHEVTSAIGHADVRVDSIHGSKKPELRDRALKEFREGVVRVLVCTEAAVRGADISGLCNVINFDLPELYDDYKNRVACAETNGGEVITLVTPNDIKPLVKLESLVGEQLPRKSAPEFDYASQPINMKPTRKKGGKSRGIRSFPLQNKKPKLKHKRGHR